MVLVSRKNRKLILEYLFKEGVLCVQKDGMKPQHDHIPVPNLHVMMVMKSLASRDLVRVKFNWQWFYYLLTDDGIKQLREELHLPSTVLPATLTKQTKGYKPGYAGDVEDRRPKGKGKGKKGKGWSSYNSGGGYEAEASGEKPEEAPAVE